MRDPGGRDSGEHPDRSSLSAYYDAKYRRRSVEDGSSTDFASIEAHLAQCIACRAELARLSEISSALDDLPTLSAPPSILEGVRDRIRIQTEAPTTPAARPVSGPGFVAWMPRAAAVLAFAALIGLGWVINEQLGDDTTEIARTDRDELTRIEEKTASRVDDERGGGEAKLRFAPPAGGSEDLAGNVKSDREWPGTALEANAKRVAKDSADAAARNDLDFATITGGGGGGDPQDDAVSDDGLEQQWSEGAARAMKLADETTRTETRELGSAPEAKRDSGDSQRASGTARQSRSRGKSATEPSTAGRYALSLGSTMIADAESLLAIDGRFILDQQATRAEDVDLYLLVEVPKETSFEESFGEVAPTKLAAFLGLGLKSTDSSLAESSRGNPKAKKRKAAKAPRRGSDGGVPEAEERDAEDDSKEKSFFGGRTYGSFPLVGDTLGLHVPAFEFRTSSDKLPALTTTVRSWQTLKGHVGPAKPRLDWRRSADALRLGKAKQDLKVRMLLVPRDSYPTEKSD